MTASEEIESLKEEHRNLPFSKQSYAVFLWACIKALASRIDKLESSKQPNK